VTYLIRFTRRLYRKVRELHIGLLQSKGHAASQAADRFLASAEAAQEQANVARELAYQAKHQADLCWEAVRGEIDLIDSPV